MSATPLTATNDIHKPLFFFHHFFKYGNLPKGNANMAYASDAIATIIGSCLGTSTCTTYIESRYDVSIFTHAHTHTTPDSDILSFFFPSLKKRWRS